MNPPSKKAAATLPLVRCAIYTRKSTEEGLEQEFNSLDAQRESAQAFIHSQTHEGWTALPDRYDDGGFTGGNMERPALQRLLADIGAGKIDCVVCYKVDRLSRSLLDFAKMMETFEQHGVSFVSITQQFNSATSMGRLVLNVLLSFAQFEREIIAERTRDKMAATRRKGKWAGGTPVLGYDLDPRGRRLHVNDDEAERVRAIFSLYLEHRSLLPVVQELARRGWVGKCWETRHGRQRGGRPFTETSLYRLLTNVLSAFAGPKLLRLLEQEGYRYAIRLKTNPVLERKIAPLLKRPVGRPSHKPKVFYRSFRYRAGSWECARRVVVRVAWHAGELFPRVGFVVTNLKWHSKKVVHFYNRRGTAEQWIKEGKNAVKWTKLSCRRFKDNAARLHLFALAYNLANFLRQLVLPTPIKGWTLTTLREKLIKIGAKVMAHAKYITFQLAEVAVPRQLFAAMLERIGRRRLAEASG